MRHSDSRLNLYTSNFAKRRSCLIQSSALDKPIKITPRFSSLSKLVFRYSSALPNACCALYPSQKSHRREDKQGAIYSIICLFISLSKTLETVGNTLAGL